MTSVLWHGASAQFSQIVLPFTVNALAQAAAELDQAYRAKVTGGEVALAFAGHSDESLKAAVTALTSALDGTYTDEQSAVKIAIMKAIQACTA